MIRPRTDPEIYLDHNSGSPLLPEVQVALREAIAETLANPSSQHAAGERARRALEKARASVALLVGAEPREVVFTSGGTEANQLALQGMLPELPAAAHLVVSSQAHASLREAAESMQRQGHRVTFVPPLPSGITPVDRILAALEPDTRLVAILSANNETGVREPHLELARALGPRQVLLHLDAVQSVGREPLDAPSSGCTTLALSGHKIGAPAGIGALWVRRGTRLRPLLRGGLQEKGRRGGTPNLLGAIALGKAAEVARARPWDASVAARRDEFEATLLRALPDTEINGSPTDRLASTSNLHFVGLDNQEILAALTRRGVHAAAGSACHAGGGQPSPVLRAMGFSAARAQASVRFSISSETRGEDLMRAADAIIGVISSLRKTGRHPPPNRSKKSRIRGSDSQDGD